MLAFKDPTTLSTWLQAHGIDSRQWGQANSKTAVHLWQELATGEATLQVDPVCRLVQVVELLVQQAGLLLLEVAQEMEDGRVRYRNRFPSEKMKPGETVQEASLRCLWEEVGLQPHQVHILSDTPQPQIVERESDSYPGLRSRYTTFRLETAVACLPPHPFWQDNASYQKGDPVRRHRWAWVTSDTVQT